MLGQIYYRRSNCANLSTLKLNYICLEQRCFLKTGIYLKENQGAQIAVKPEYKFHKKGFFVNYNPLEFVDE